MTVHVKTVTDDNRTLADQQDELDNKWGPWRQNYGGLLDTLTTITNIDGTHFPSLALNVHDPSGFRHFVNLAHVVEIWESEGGLARDEDLIVDVSGGRTAADLPRPRRGER